MRHQMRLKDARFQMIWDGEKTIELRLLDEKRKLVNIGDIIEFSNLSNPGQIIVVKVISIYVFDSFETLYKSLPLEKCGYTQSDVRSASASDMNAYYSIEEQLKYGVVGIEFELEEKWTKTN